MRLILALVVLAVLMAGCDGRGPPACVPPMSGKDVAPDSPNQGGPQGSQVVVNVADVEGTPLPGAGVVVAWNRDVIDPEAPPANPTLVVLRLATGPDGQVRASVPHERYYVAAAWAPGHTEEWIPLQEPMRGSATWTLKLYPDGIAAAANGTYPGPAASGTADPWPTWRPLELPFAQAGDAAAIRGRLVRAEAGLSWEFQVPEQADLFLVAGPDDGQPSQWSDRKTYGVNDGRHEARILLLPTSGAGRDERSWPALGEGTLWVGPAVSQVLVTLDGIPFHVDANLTLDHRAVMQERCGTLFPGSAQEIYDPGEPAHNPPLAAARESPATPWLAAGLVLVAAAAARRAQP